MTLYEDIRVDGRGDIDTPGDYIRQIAATLAHWLAVHTDNEAWAAMWASPYGGFEDMMKHGGTKIEIMGCEFDLAEEIVEAWCDRYSGDFSQCSVCGCIYENGYDDMCECQKEYDEGHEAHEEWEAWEPDEELDETEDDRPDEPDEPEEPEALDVTTRDLMEYMEGIYGTRDGWDGEWVASITTEWTLQQVMEGAAFEWYRDTISNMSHVDTCIEEVQDALKQLRDGLANDLGREELLAAATMASHIWHVHGNIMRDYADNVGGDSSKLENIQQTGLAGEIDQEEIDAWLRGETDEDFEWELEAIIDQVEHLL